MNFVYKLVTIIQEFLICPCRILQQFYYRTLVSKNSFAYRFSRSTFDAVLFLTEEFKVPKVIKNIEIFLTNIRTCFICAYEIWSKSGSTANHLPELNFTSNFFIENKIYNFWNINAGIKHINTYCNL